MNKRMSDRDGLSRPQIWRIDRLQMTRYKNGKDGIYDVGGTLIMPPMSSEGVRHSDNKMVAFILSLVCLWILICILGSGLIQKQMEPTKLITSLPVLDEQTPSITIRP